MGFSKERLSNRVGRLKEVLGGEAVKSYEFSGHRGPVIGIHGIFGMWPNGSVRSYMLQNDVEGSLLYLGALTKGLETYLPDVEEKIEKHPGALILGYSVGGILALRYARRHGWNNFLKIITIGTPFDGIPKSLGIFGKTIRQLPPESEILREITELDPPNGKVLSIFAKSDRYVKKPEELKLNWPSAILGAESHADLMNRFGWVAPIIDAELDRF